KDHVRIILNLVENGLLVWPTIEQEDGTVRLKTYEELSDKEKLQDDYDLKATNIVLQGLPLDFYALVNHYKIAKDIWDKVKLLILPLEWGKFVTDVKLARNLHTSNYDQLYSYLEQHEANTNEARLMRERFPEPLALVANYHPETSHFTTIILSQVKDIKCYNCQGEGHMARQYTQPKQGRDDAWFKEKTNDLDDYDSDCDDISSTKAVLMDNISSCDSNFLTKNTKFAAFKMEIDTLKQALSKHIKEKESLLTTLNGFQTEFKESESKSIDKEIVLENKNKELEKIVCFHDEITEVQTVFTQMEAAVEQCSVDRKCCQIQQKQFLIINDRLLDKIISQEIVNIVLNSSSIIRDSEKNNEDSVDTSNKCLELKAELVKKNDVYIELSKQFSNLEQHSISREVSMQLNKEFFQKDKSSDNKNYPEIQEYFEQNDLKAQLQAKDTVISKLKETIHSLRENANLAKVKKDIDEIETINIELEHSEIIESARALSPLDSNLDSAYKYVLRIQEVLLYVRDTRPCLTRPSEKLVAVTPKNKDKKVRFDDPITFSSNTQKQVDSHKPKDSNQPLLHSTRVIGSTGASGLKPT
nr:hypothetical protein [Tanacetum cinerariifolium]